MEDEELLDLVDIHDNVIGKIYRSEKYEKMNNQFLRASEAFLYNAQGQLWIPTRAPHKTIAPGGLDYSASGHVASGESYLKAMIREIEEELNLKVDPTKLKMIYKFPPTGDEKLFFRAIFTYQSDKVPNYSHEDFSGYEWLMPEELLLKLRGGRPAKQSMLETVDYLIKNKKMPGFSMP